MQVVMQPVMNYDYYDGKYYSNSGYFPLQHFGAFAFVAEMVPKSDNLSAVGSLQHYSDYGTAGIFDCEFFFWVFFFMFSRCRRIYHQRASA